MVEVAPEVILDQETKKKTLIGERITKLDAPEKAAGLTRYIEDMKKPRMLYGKILFAGRPHARILKIDTSEAKAMQGVTSLAEVNRVTVE